MEFLLLWLYKGHSRTLTIGGWSTKHSTSKLVCLKYLAGSIGIAIATSYSFVVCFEFWIEALRPVNDSSVYPRLITVCLSKPSMGTYTVIVSNRNNSQLTRGKRTRPFYSLFPSRSAGLFTPRTANWRTADNSLAAHEPHTIYINGHSKNVPQ